MHKACLSRRPFIPDIIMVCQKTGAKDRGLCRLTYRLLIKVLVFVSQEQKFIQEPIEIIQERIEINHASSICFLPEKKTTIKCTDRDSTWVPDEPKLRQIVVPFARIHPTTMLSNSHGINFFEWGIKNFNLCKRPSRNLLFYPFLFYSRVGWNITFKIKCQPFSIPSNKLRMWMDV